MEKVIDELLWYIQRSNNGPYSIFVTEATQKLKDLDLWDRGGKKILHDHILSEFGFELEERSTVVKADSNSEIAPSSEEMLINHIQHWASWAKHNTNSPTYQLLVLFNII